jgi:F-type H+-transporting ATPase subunit delta
MLNLVSQQSLAELTESTLGIAADLDDSGLRTLGGELAAVAGLLRSEPAVRRALSDSSVAASRRSDLVRQLFGSKVSSSTSRVLNNVVSAEFSTGGDLVTALRRLGRTAMFLRAERTGTLDDVEDQIFRFGRLIAGNPELARALDDQHRATRDKEELIRRLLDGKAAPLTVELLSALAGDSEGRAFSYGVDQLVDEAAQRQVKVVAMVTSAVELTPDQQARLTAGLQHIYSRPVVIHVDVDPSLQGGLLVRVGDEVIDGSISGRIAELKARLSG